MNTTKRVLLGLLSSLLLAVGFARAADRFDPMTTDLGTSTHSSLHLAPGPDCVSPCVGEN